MAIVTGSLAEVYVGGVSGTGTKVPGVISVSLPDTRSMIDVTVAGATAAQSLPGLKAGTITVEAYLDYSNSALETAITGGSTTSVYVYLDGASGAEMSFSTCYATRSIQSGGPNAAARATLTFHNAA